jgi:hypothetical protein
MAAKQTLETRRVPQFHAHGCCNCGRRYQDACDSPLRNGYCNTCKLGHPPMVTEVNYEPRACCLVASRLMTTVDDHKRWALGGEGPWYRCMTCSRTHPFNPAERKP